MKPLMRTRTQQAQRKADGTTAPKPATTLAALAGEPEDLAGASDDDTESEEGASRLTVDVSYRVPGSPLPLKGAIVLRAPSAYDEIMIGRAKARLCGGLPIASFDGAAQEVITALAVCQVVIEEAPKWFRGLEGDQIHADIYLGLYREWAAFAAAYFRRRAGEGQEEEGEPAVSVRPRLRGGDGAQG